MEKGEYLLDEDELVGRTTAGNAEADDHGGPADDRVVSGAEEGGKESSGHRREEGAESEIIEGRRHGEIRENVHQGRDVKHPGRGGRKGREGCGSGMQMPSRRTRLAVALAALGFVGVVGLWWAHGRTRTEVARGTHAGGSSATVAGLPPELAKVLRSERQAVIRHPTPSPAPQQFPAGGKSIAVQQAIVGGAVLAGRHHAVTHVPNEKAVVPVSGKTILSGQDTPLAPAGKALAGGKALASSKALLVGEALRAGESSQGSAQAPAVHHGAVPKKGAARQDSGFVAGGGDQAKVLEEIRSLKVEMAGVKAALANERKAVGTLPSMDKRLVVLHGALERLLKNAEAGSHAKVRDGRRGKKGKAHAGSRRVKRVMGYRLLAVVGDQAVVEDMGTGRVRVLRTNERLDGLVVYQVAGGAVVTNYGVMGEK